jgi:hypothetical protein
MALHRLLGFTTAVPNPDEVANFYREAGIVEANGRYHGSDDGASVRLEEGDFRRLVQVDVGAESESDIDAIAERLRHNGASPIVTSGELHVVEAASQVRFVVKVVELEAVGAPVSPFPVNAYGNIVRRNRRAAGVFATARAPRRLGHLVIGSPNRQATRDFIVNGLGFKSSDEIDGVISFLRCSFEHHNIAVVDSEVPILQHYSWECDDTDHVGSLASSLLRFTPERHVWGLGRHFAGSNYYWYLRDPSGAFIELYSDMDIIDDDEEWDRHGRTPFEFEHVANAWGPNLPLEFVIPADLENLKEHWSKR